MFRRRLGRGSSRSGSSPHEQAPSLRWGHALDKALQASLGNLPALPGRTLILVDTSASMTDAE